MIKANSIYNEYINFIKNNMDICKKKSADIHDFMYHSDLFIRNKLNTKTLLIPKIYSKDTVNHLTEIHDTVSCICNKITSAYLSNSKYREIFPFSKKLQDLILLPRNYDTLIPLARYDIFYSEDTGDFKFCEFNTDGSSGMNRNRILNSAYIDNPAHEFILEKYRLIPFELFDSLISEFLNIYNTYSKAGSTPRIAIIDFLDRGNINEFKEFARRFNAIGIPCHICDIRELKYDGKTLKTRDGYSIDSIYRRAVTTDILEHIDEVEPLINCIADGNVFMFGSFCTQIIHNKWIFPALYHKLTWELLTNKEIEFIKKHIPATLPFTDIKLKNEVIQNKDKFILKPIDAYDGKGVFPGISYSNEEWKFISSSCFDSGYLCQEYYTPYKSKNIDFIDEENGVFKDYINMTGLYSYNGKLAGFYNRLSSLEIISSDREERTVPTYQVFQ